MLPSLRPLRAILIAPVLMLLASAPAASAAPTHDAFERDVLTKINALRSDQGLRPLRTSRKLANAASRHSRKQLIDDRLSHTIDFGTPSKGRAAKGVRGETVAWLPDGMSRRADRAVTMWMQSPGHRAQLMGPRFRKVGIGRWYGAMGPDPGIALTAGFSSK